MNQISHWQEGKNGKVVGLIKKELGGKIMKETSALEGKTYENLTDNKNKDKKEKGTKKHTIKR